MTEINAQEYLNKNWTDKQLKSISSPTEKLSGELTIADYPNLEEITLPNQELTSLTVINCPNLKQINARNNKLTKLALDSSELTELIGGQNELTTLDLSNCQKVKKLIVPDNPYLTKITGLNLALIVNLNLTNTSVSLNEDYEELKSENKHLYQALNRANEARIEKELKWVEPIQTVKQAEEAIQRLLEKTGQRWLNHFTGQEVDEILATRLNTPQKREKAKDILKWIFETQTSKDYEGLATKWSEGEEWKKTRLREEFESPYEFDCSTLNTLVQHLLNIRELQEKQH